MRLVKTLAVLAIAAGLIGVVSAAGTGTAEPKYKIKDVMKEAMKGGLCKKVADGEGSDEDKKLLVEMFEALGENTPPEGDADSWKQKTSALLKAAKAALAGEEGAGGALRKAANCKACHDVHKG